MKKSIAVLLLMVCLGCLMNSGLSALEKTDFSNTTKIYIDPQNVHFHENNIYVGVNQNWLQTDAIHADENGLYMVDYWMCEYCKYTGSKGLWTCDSCGRRRN